MQMQLLCLILSLVLCLAHAFSQSKLFRHHTPTHIRTRYSQRNIQSSFRLDSTTTESETAVSDDRIIIVTPKAKEHLTLLKSKVGNNRILRMGVKAGGCSGMSYVMDFVDENTLTEDDQVEVYDDIKCVVDSKSLLYLYGLQLDYSDELIGGGFKFSNPNAESNCGCGKSFGI